MTTETFLKIKELLDKNSIEYTHVVHEHVHRSEDAAKIRGTRLDQAAKAIIVKATGKESTSFIQIVLPGDERIDLKKIKNMLGTKNVSLASPEEVLERTGCTIGSVPPFGILFGIPVYLEKTILDKTEIVFSAGTHNDSIIMKPEDYLKIVDPKVEDLRKKEENSA